MLFPGRTVEAPGTGHHCLLVHHCLHHLHLRAGVRGLALPTHHAGRCPFPLSIGLIGSQNALMGLVFASRLLPFISFDIVSYAAGLTVLSFWRFAIASLVGIAPTSFLFAHLGLEMGTGESHRIAFAVWRLGASP